MCGSGQCPVVHVSIVCSCHTRLVQVINGELSIRVPKTAETKQQQENKVQ